MTCKILGSVSLSPTVRSKTSIGSYLLTTWGWQWSWPADWTGLYNVTSFWLALDCDGASFFNLFSNHGGEAAARASNTTQQCTIADGLNKSVCIVLKNIPTLRLKIKVKASQTASLWKVPVPSWTQTFKWKPLKYLADCCWSVPVHYQWW